MPTAPERSYRALLAVPGLPRVLAGMLTSRVAEGMTGIAFVLFTLQRFGDPALAGLVTFVSIVPGLVVSPLAGALLDRQGRTRLIVLDLSLAASALLALSVLALADALPAWLLLTIVGLSSVTSPLSRTGLRSLFPIIVPEHLWERANAVDSNGYVLATLVGPPAAGALVQLAGGPAAMAVIGVVFAASAVILTRSPDPQVETASSGSLLRDAWEGLLYTVRNRALLGLAVSISTLNIGGGALVIVIPLLVLERLGGSEATVGLLFAVQGLAGAFAAFIFGRVDSDGRERLMIALPMLGMSAAFGLLSIPSLVAIGVTMVVVGFLNGPMDIALFTLRQRRTDPAWTGRAFAISMSLNYVGSPIGSLVAGGLGTAHLEATIAMAVVVALLGASFAWLLLPRGSIATATEPAG